MKGDVIIIGDQHVKAAGEIIKQTAKAIQKKNGIYLFTIAGESGAGKSELASALKDGLSERGIQAGIIQQDDYFILPPKSNEKKRLEDINWVGPGEVNLGILNKNINEILKGSVIIEKPLVIFDEDRITREIMDLTPFSVIIIEGTYTTLVENIDCRIFIDRDRFDTLPDRIKRNREVQNEFLERILEIEHHVISRHKEMADIIVGKEFNVYSA